jgi:hypothetical protein
VDWFGELEELFMQKDTLMVISKNGIHPTGAKYRVYGEIYYVSELVMMGNIIYAAYQVLSL